jgi:hypothetical protein
MENVEQWFANNCPYLEGVAIYSGLKVRNANLLRLFKLKESAANLEKLKYELGKLRSTTTPATKSIEEKPIVNIEATAVAAEKKQQLMFHNLPPELRPELLKANELFRKNCFLKVTLNELPSAAETEALHLQLQISDNFKINRICWQKIDFWLEHRQLPKEVTSGFEKLTGAQLVKKQQYLFQNISKMKRRFDENLKQLSAAENLSTKGRLQRLVTKQDADLIKKNEELQIITRLIDGR